MTARGFALGVIAAAVLLLGSTMALNVALDPEGVFGTHPGAPRVNENMRFTRLNTYRATQPRPDGVLFASSRGLLFDYEALARAMRVNAVANFSVGYGMVTDHLPTLEYLIRDKASRGERLKAVLLMLDVDHFGKPAWTNVNLDGFLPPEVSGEHPLRFWWRFLTAFQPRVWLATLRKEPGRRAGTPLGRLRPIPAAMVPPLPLPAPRAHLAAASAPAERRPQVVRPHLDEHLRLLARIAARCRQHDIALTVVTSPLNRVNAREYDPAELTRIVERISRVVPVWDFGSPDWLSDRADLWDDPSHFATPVTRMMIDRVFNGRSEPAGFGIRHGG